VELREAGLLLYSAKYTAWQRARLISSDARESTASSRSRPLSTKSSSWPASTAPPSSAAPCRLMRVSKVQVPAVSCLLPGCVWEACAALELLS